MSPYNRLLIKFACKIAIPSNESHSWNKALDFITNPDKHKSVMEQAKRELDISINAIRKAPPPNPYTSRSDDAICQLILDKMNNPVGTNK